jgi:hypothetical protein
MAEQVVGLSVDRGRLEQSVHDAQERRLEQDRQAAGEHRRAGFPVQLGQLLVEPLRVPLVLLAQCVDLRRQCGAGAFATYGGAAERVEE